MTRNQIWRAYAKRLTERERYYAPKVTKALMRQVQDYVASLRAGRPGSVPELYNRDIAMVIQRMQTDMAVREARIHLANLKADEAKRIGRNEQWIMEVISQLATHNAKFVVGISETTRDLLYQYLSEGLAEGLTLTEIADKIEAEVPALYESRGFTIARTELNRGAGMAVNLAAKSYPYETEKTWITAGDHRVRGNMPEQKFSHKILDGVKINTFDTTGQPNAFNNGEQITQPGDPKASAGNTINCRCTVALTGKRDSNGKLIRRQSSRFSSV